MTEAKSPRSSDPETVARIYLRRHRTENESDFWAFEAVSDCVFEDPERAWKILLELVRQAEWEDLGYIGAGLLEDLCVRRGSEFVDRVEAQANADGKFRIALGNVWLRSTDATPDVVRRLVVASGGKIQPLRPDEEKDDPQDSGLTRA